MVDQYDVECNEWNKGVTFFRLVCAIATARAIVLASVPEFVKRTLSILLNRLTICLASLTSFSLD